MKSWKLVFSPNFLLWACWIPDEVPIPLTFESPRNRYGTNVSGCVRPSSNYSKIPKCLLLCIILYGHKGHTGFICEFGRAYSVGCEGTQLLLAKVKNASGR